jgi:hypothetical protein
VSLPGAKLPEILGPLHGRCQGEKIRDFSTVPPFPRPVQPNPISASIELDLTPLTRSEAGQD